MGGCRQSASRLTSVAKPSGQEYNGVEKRRRICEAPEKNWAWPKVANSLQRQNQREMLPAVQRARFKVQGGDARFVTRAGNNGRNWAQTHSFLDTTKESEGLCTVCKEVAR